MDKKKIFYDKKIMS